MFTIIIVLHAIICILLIVIILVQRGHGGGLVENLSNLDSMFGTKTNSFLSRTTSVFATLFLLTCLSLALLSARQGKSLMSRVKPASEKSPQQTQTQAVPETELPAGGQARGQVPQQAAAAQQPELPIVPPVSPPQPKVSSQPDTLPQAGAPSEAGGG
jgi:preprotein translocase subunit SecG